MQKFAISVVVAALIVLGLTSFESQDFLTYSVDLPENPFFYWTIFGALVAAGNVYVILSSHREMDKKMATHFS